MKSVEPVEMDLAFLAGRLAEYNPRTIDPDQADRLSRSLGEFGVVQGVVFNTRTQTVIGGHQTIRAAVEAGNVQRLWVFPVDLDEAHEKALNLALNRISGKFDWMKVAEIVKELDECDDLDVIDLAGFPEFELQPLISSDWTKPSPAENAKDRTALMLSFSKEEADVVSQAIVLFRTRSGDESLRRSLVVAKICEGFLGEGS